MSLRYKIVGTRTVKLIDGKPVVTSRSIHVHDRLDDVTTFIDRYVIPAILGIDIAGTAFALSVLILYRILH